MIKTGFVGLDELIGGYKEEISCIYGVPASGKTTLAMLVAIEQSREGKKVLFLQRKPKNYGETVWAIPAGKIEQGESQLITLSIEEREGEYLWCNYFDERETDECYFVAKDGYIFSEAPYFSGDIFFRFYSYLGDNPVGKNIIESEKFKRLMFFKNNLLKLSINPHLFFIRGDGDYEFLFNNTSFNRWEAPKIIFKTEDDFEEIYKKLEMVLRTDPLSLNFQEKLSSLLYIDLRYDGKVPFKFK